MSSETIYGIVIGTVASFLITWVFHVIQGRRKKVIRKQLEELDSHMEYVGRLRDSDEYRLGVAFFWLFAILFLVAVGLLASALTKIIPTPGLTSLFNFLSFSCFLAAALAAYFEAGSFRDLSNIERTTKRIEDKREKLKQQLEDA